MEALLYSLAKRYGGKGVLLEDLYQEAWVVYLENPKLSIPRMCSKVRTRLGRMLAKEYKYNEKKDLELLTKNGTITPEEILEKRMLFVEWKKAVERLPLQEYYVVALMWGFTGLGDKTFREVAKMTGRSTKYVKTKVKKASEMVEKHFRRGYVV